LIQGITGLHLIETPETAGFVLRLALLFERALGTLTSLYTANSSGAMRFLALHGVAAEKVRFVPNGVDIAFWSPRKGPVAGEPVVICVARLVARKRHVDLLEALAALHKRGVNFRATLIGSGELETDLRAEIGRLQLEGVVEITGSLPPENVRSRMQTGDVFALVSRWEGMPGSVLEAMACGLPVVGTRVNGIADLVIPGVTGWLVPPEDPEALREALEAALTNRGLRTRMGLNARERVEREFALSQSVIALERAYEEVAAMPSPVPWSRFARSSADGSDSDRTRKP
jgi:glycosyltransferase involved in cell wall biosynthesis